MAKVIETNEVEREKLLPVAYCLAAGYVVIMLIGYFIGGSIY
jgi:hypothetical protein